MLSSVSNRIRKYQRTIENEKDKEAQILLCQNWTANAWEASAVTLSSQNSNIWTRLGRKSSSKAIHQNCQVCKLFQAPKCLRQLAQQCTDKGVGGQQPRRMWRTNYMIEVKELINIAMAVWATHGCTVEHDRDSCWVKSASEEKASLFRRLESDISNGKVL